MAPNERSPLLSRPESSQENGDLTASQEKGLAGSKALGIVLALVGVFMAGADHSFVMATYVEVASSVGELHNAPWLITGYNLGYCIALPLYGRLGDSLGRKTPLIWAYFLFGIGCLLSGIGFSFWCIIIGRVINGIGAAGMVSLVSVVITDNAPPSEAASLRSYVQVVTVLGRSSGGPLGAFISQSLNWKLSFLLQVPIIMVCGLSSLILMPESQTAKMKVNSPNDKAQSKDFDLLGLATFSLTITLFLIASGKASQSDSETNSTHLSLYVGLTMIFGLLFILVETFLAKNPLLSLMGSVINIHMAVQIFLFVAYASHMSNLAPYFTYVEGFASPKTACYIIASPIGFTLGSIVGGQLIKRTHHSKLQSILALAAGVLTYVLISVQWTYNSHTLELLYIFLSGFTLGLLLIATFAAMAAAAPKNLVATTITNYFLCQQIGSMMGTGVSTSMLRGIFRSFLRTELEGNADRDRIIRGVLKDIKFSKTLPSQLQEQIRMLFLNSFHYVALFAGMAACLALPLLLALPEEILE